MNFPPMLLEKGLEKVLVQLSVQSIPNGFYLEPFLTGKHTVVGFYIEPLSVNPQPYHLRFDL